MDWAKETLQKPMWKGRNKKWERQKNRLLRKWQRQCTGNIGFGSGSTSYLTANEIKKVQTEHLNIVLFLRHTE